MKNICAMTLAAVTLCTGALLWADADTPPSGSFKNIVIQGVSRLHMRSDKPTETPLFSPKEAVIQYLEENMEMLSPGDKILLNFPTLLPARLGSDIVASPLHRLLWMPPVLDLTISNVPVSGVAHWRLTITDDGGSVFRTISGRGRLPSHIRWDGLGDSGEPLRVGHAYSCALAALDTTDIPSYLSSKTVRLSSYVDAHKNKVHIALDTTVLFPHGLRLSEDGQKRLLEARDLLRNFYRGTIKVEVYGNDADLARQEAEIIRDYLAENLSLGKETIKAIGRSAGADLYLRTEISGR